MNAETASDAIAPQAAGAMTAALATQHADLYCALCTKQHDLLLGLLEAFGQASQGAREALMVRPMGLSCSAVPSAALVAAWSAGSLWTPAGLSWRGDVLVRQNAVSAPPDGWMGLGP